VNDPQVVFPVALAAFGFFCAWLGILFVILKDEEIEL